VSNTASHSPERKGKKKKGGEERRRRRRREEVNFGAEAFLFQAAITGSDLNILRRELCDLRFSTFCAISSNLVYSSLDI
jgi:hypothetical protein